MPEALTLHADALLALFEKAGLIDNQHAFRIAEMHDHLGAQIIADLVGIPRRTAEPVLDAVRRGVSGLLGELPAVFALHRAEQPCK